MPFSRRTGALLGLSSAENAAISVATLGAALIFRGDHLPDLASLAWIVALLHLAGYALAKGCLFHAADGVFAVTGSYAIVHTDLFRRASILFGVGALFAAMSLAAMPPQAGFVSEWYVFPTVLQGFHLSTLRCDWYLLMRWHRCSGPTCSGRQRGSCASLPIG